MIDEPRATVPRATFQAIAIPELLLLGTDVAASLVGPTRRVSRSGTCAAACLVPRVEMSTTIPSTRTRRT